ncbi:MAG: BrnA antitoxin family protein [bacterium]|nr:BrnA antitoxin family protein [bacterium]
MAKRRKQLKPPKFRGEDAERAFWAKVNLAEHFGPEDFSRAAFPDLKPSSRAISIRIPEHLLMRLKEQANVLDVPYQSLIKRYIANGMRDPRA